MLLLFGHVLFFSSTLVKAVAFNQQDAAEALAGMGNVNVQQPGQNLPGMNGFGPWFAGILGNQVEVDNLINLLFVCAVIISGLGYGLVQVIAQMAITGTYAGVIGMVTVACSFVLWHLIGHAPAHGENPPDNFQMAALRVACVCSTPEPPQSPTTDLCYNLRYSLSYDGRSI